MTTGSPPKVSAWQRPERPDPCIPINVGAAVQPWSGVAAIRARGSMQQSGVAWSSHDGTNVVRSSVMRTVDRTRSRLSAAVVRPKASRSGWPKTRGRDSGPPARPGSHRRPQSRRAFGKKPPRTARFDSNLSHCRQPLQTHKLEPHHRRRCDGAVNRRSDVPVERCPTSVAHQARSRRAQA